MSNVYCVVIRQLSNHIPVVTAIITEPESPVDDLDHYFKSEAEIKIAEFKRKFVEFNSADFYIQKISSYSDLVVQLILE